jgi:hypothetical protein
MGGQACILYGGAEFSRDIDFAIAVTAGNLDRLRDALAELAAEPVYFPPLSEDALRRGHACHFRCQRRGVEGFRIDVMSKMRGVAPFETCWSRRTRLRLAGVGLVSVMSIQDLVNAKKTQRDKDWPMIRRLVEADIVRYAEAPSRARRTFWLRECRSPQILCELAGRWPALAKRLSHRRPALAVALLGDTDAVTVALEHEEQRERELDRQYWAPLRAELERWRLDRHGRATPTRRGPGRREGR